MIIPASEPPGGLASRERRSSDAPRRVGPAAARHNRRMRIVDEAGLATRLGLVGPDPRVIASGSLAVPCTVLGMLDRVLPRWRLHVLNAQLPLPDRPEVTYETAFVGPMMRGRPGLRYYPSRLSLLPRFFGSLIPPDIVVVHTSKPHGAYVSLGIEVNVLPDAIDAARARGALVVAQVNDQMPFTHGDGVIPLEDIDLGIEVSEPIPTIAPLEPDADELAIGELIAARVPDGATLQVGIGAIPSAAIQALSRHRGLGIWTELMTDGVLALRRAGALNPDRIVVCSFMAGSQELYDWVDDNAQVQVLRAVRSNDPGRIARQPAMTSINTALQVDLFLQANASRVRNEIYSGIGGQPDFVVGAMHSPGGHAYLAMRSWHKKADTSTVVGKIDEVATSVQMSAIVTEQGLADTFGRTQQEQAIELIERAAHPDAREHLREEAVRLRLFDRYPG